jgi:hypothetical protein
MNFHPDYIIQKILLPARDGVILDGLYIHKKDNLENRIFLSLIGTFPCEFSYISKNASSLYELFSNPILLMNHRNYSARSTHYTDSIEILAEDVLDFFDYFYRQKKQIVLYGMCGGSAQIIIAAKILADKKLPFKLIIDRFANTYLDFVSLKTQLRHFKFISYLSWQQKCFLLFIYFLATILLPIRNLNPHFNKLIQHVPKNDVLVLEAKSKRIVGKREPLVSDLTIHPENNIRNTFRERRHQEKKILKKMVFLSIEIDNLCVVSSSSPLATAFKKLSVYFLECIKLMDNEKLQVSHEVTSSDKPIDAHGYLLFDLTTRNRLPITPFLLGFIRTTKSSCLSILKTMRPLSAEKIESLFKQQSILFFERENLLKISKLLENFLEILNEHQEMIGYLADRLKHTGLGNMMSIFKELQEELFNTPSNDVNPKKTP